MFNFGSVVWKDSTNLKVTGAAITKGECRSAEGKEFNFTPELMNKILSHFTDAVPIKMGHGATPEIGRAFKLGYDALSQNLPFIGHVYGDDKRQEIESKGQNKISPEIDFTFDASGNPIDGVITALALVPIPAMEGTEVNCMSMTFSAPSHPWRYDKDEKSGWEKPALGAFTDKSWGDMSDKERANIAGHFAYSEELPATSFGALKFPHHDPKTHAVVWAAVANAMARLKQSSISSDDKKEVYKHLAKHYKEFNKPVPAMFEADHMKEGIMVFYPKGTEIVPPTVNNTVVETPTESTSIAAFEADVVKYKGIIAKFEADTAKITADLEALKVQNGELLKQKGELDVQITDYKTKVDTLMNENGGFLKEKTDVLVAELKGMGFKAPETIAADLAPKQRIDVLNQMKSNFVINAPPVAPTTPVETPPAPKTGKAAVLETIPEELRKYIKSGV